MKHIAAIGLSLSLLCSCGGPQNSDSVSTSSATFQFVHQSNDLRFKIRTSDAQLIEQARGELKKPSSDRNLFPNGDLVRGDGGVNAPWSWSFVEDAWMLTEVSIELCDASPDYVEDHLDDWLENPGTFCPWASRIEKEIE